jgi:hypothetical protein
VPRERTGADGDQNSQGAIVTKQRLFPKGSAT